MDKDCTLSINSPISRAVSIDDAITARSAKAQITWKCLGSKWSQALDTGKAESVKSCCTAHPLICMSIGTASACLIHGIGRGVPNEMHMRPRQCTNAMSKKKKKKKKKKNLITST